MAFCEGDHYYDVFDPRENETARAECIMSAQWSDFEWVQPYNSKSEKVFLVVGIVTIAISVGLMVFFHKHRATKVMKASRIFAFGVLSGFIVLILGLFMWPLQSNEAVCFVKPWFLALGFGLVGGALLSRLYHLYYFFWLSNNPNRPIRELLQYQTPEKAQSRDQRLRLYFVGIIILELLLILIMESVPASRPNVNYECCPVDEKVYTVCQFSDAFGWTAFVVNLVPIIMGLFFLIRVHQLHHQISKSVAKKKRQDAETSAASRFSDGASAEEQIKAALDRELKRFRPIEIILFWVAFCGVVLTIIGYTGLVLESMDGRLAYYCLRGIMFITIVWLCLYRIFKPMVDEINIIANPARTAETNPNVTPKTSYNATNTGSAAKPSTQPETTGATTSDTVAPEAEIAENPAKTSSYTEMTAV
ncbi:Hypothetical Protein FCC1311_006052 [Hondaea fermentalgiana]|uniref:G-protein coupled receptors family 3 profile domain-containing protein n=1 Tax=Hondaea fermentalgiana TaxID=2315210 RepID=A0A2R5G038_9STRA|nr:Hypothetical Protein FCC1311_006052 [Hondaea fermentalgiana]|eukprot:GBG24387.1 Hypothetical Protein FCC1311_006052 [Hondaea fermentalgiana]